MPSVTIIVVEKNGTIKEVDMKNYDEEELYKKAGFKTKEGFTNHTQWAIPELNGKTYSISMYGKTTGRANQENKYEFPPPIDTVLFFGNCVLVNTVGGKPTNLSAKEWDGIYQFLYGGFEDLDDEDSELSEDDEEDEQLPRTKSGYVKDEFIVDDDEEEEEESEEEEEESEEEEVYIPTKKRARKPAEKKTKGKKANNTPLTVFEMATAESNYLDCASELSEEPYV
jgi:hypothetical protein